MEWIVIHPSKRITYLDLWVWIKGLRFSLFFFLLILKISLFMAVLGLPFSMDFPLYMIFSQFSSVAHSYLTLCNPMDCSTPGPPVHHQILELTQTHLHRVGDAIQPSHPLSSPSPPVSNLSQHQGLFQWVSSSNHVAKVLEFQLQHQSFQWIFRTDFL